MIRRQKFLELLEERQIASALQTLQNELTTLKINAEELHGLSSYHVGEHDSSQEHLSPAMCIPPHRLNTLFEQALLLQQKNCVYHNQDTPTGLLNDHVCKRQDFPNHATHIFQEHRDEVWYMAFSHDGTRLASASRDARAIIWDVENYKVRFILSDHKKAIAYLAWSPDDSLLLTASNDHSLKVWDSKTGDLVQTYAKHADAVTSCVWHPSGHSFFSGSVEKNMYHWSLNGDILHHWPGVRIMDLAITSNGQTLIATTDKRIRFFDLSDSSEKESIIENDSVTAITLSSDNKYLLVNLSISEIHLWNLESRTLEKKYSGQQQGRFVIRSCLGGVHENFVLSGSDGTLRVFTVDNRIYVWHRELGTLIENLAGHSACVNCVAWNPKTASFASASDDHSIRVWGPGPHKNRAILTKQKQD
ncbi:hypothetical protein HDV03_004194 [Kappamyces sp. JEL0829]|nr:hypothetical protein HDV03_004194 [Kappamyces sp. JEL0829]